MKKFLIGFASASLVAVVFAVTLAVTEAQLIHPGTPGWVRFVLAAINGPASSTDNAVVRWDGTGGDTVQDSGVIIDDSDVMTGVSLDAARITAGTLVHERGGLEFDLSAITTDNFLVGVSLGVVGIENSGQARNSLDMGTGDSPEFTAVNVGAATDTTITRASAGVINVEGDALVSAVMDCAGGDCAQIVAGSTDALDFSAVDASDTTEGLHFPQGSTCTANTAEGQVCWDTDGDFLVVGDASGVKRVSPGGVQTLWLPADEWTPAVTNGAAAYSSTETTALRPDVNSLAFATAADDFAQAQIAFSTAWNLGTITYQVYWSHPSTTTNFDVLWAFECVSVGNDDTIDVVYGTVVTLGDTGGTTEDLYVSPESAAVTCGGTPADGDITFFQIYRDVSGDAMAVDAELHGVKIFFTTDTAI